MKPVEGLLIISVYGCYRVLTCEECGYTTIDEIGRACPMCCIPFINAVLLLEGTIFDTRKS